MTRMLSIETSGTTCGASVSIDGLLISISEVYRMNVHEEHLQHCVANALETAALAITEIDVVAVSAGPGSFTGLRIGLSFAKGLCFDGAIAMLGIDTLESCAWASREVALASNNAVIHCLIPSHRDLFYIGSYTVTPLGLEPAHSKQVVELVSLEECRKRTTSGLVCGPGAPSVTPSSISGLTRLSSRFVALAAWKRLQQHPKSFDDAMTFESMYRQEWVVASPPAI